MTLNTIIMAAMERGFTMADIRRMQLGEVVDFVIEYNERMKESQAAADRRKSMKKYKFATPKETSAYTRS